MSKDCTEFEILISAAIDGELHPDEFRELESHVDHCRECRRQYLNFESVNDWVIANDVDSALPEFPFPRLPLCENENTNHENKYLVETSGRNERESMLPVNGHSRAPVQPFSGEKRRPTRNGTSNRGRTFLAGGLLAATAAGLAALLSNNPDEIVSSPINTTDISISLEKASLLHEQTHTIQVSQTLAIEQELRTLKLMSQHSGGDPSELNLIESKIDALMRRVNALNNSSLSP